MSKKKWSLKRKLKSCHKVHALNSYLFKVRIHNRDLLRDHHISYEQITGEAVQDSGTGKYVLEDWLSKKKNPDLYSSKKKKTPTCCVCQFPLCTYSPHRPFQVANVTSLKVENGRDVHSQLSGDHTAALAHNSKNGPHRGRSQKHNKHWWKATNSSAFWSCLTWEQIELFSSTQTQCDHL